MLGGTSFYACSAFYLPYNLIHDSLELVVEFSVVNRLGQFAVKHLLLDRAAVRDHKSRIVQSGFGFLYGHIQIRIGNVDTLDVLIKSKNRISVKRELRRVEAHRFQIRSCKAETLELFFFYVQILFMFKRC